MAVPKRKLVLWIVSVFNVCSFMFFTGIQGDVPDDVVYTELHKDVRIGDRAVLPCQFRGSPMAVYWKKGYDPRQSPNLVSWIPTDDVTGKCERQRICDIMEMNENHSLIIKEVGFAERGRYICRVANYKGNIIHNFTDVSLYAPPTEPYPVINGCTNNVSSASNPEPCRVLTNKTITITCSVVNYYPDIELFFLHGTRQMATINQQEQTNVDSTKNMSISMEADPSETVYTCVASDVPGSKERKATSILVESSIIIPSVTRATSIEAMTERSPDNRTVKIVVPLIIVFAFGAAGLVIWWKKKKGNTCKYDTAEKEEDNNSHQEGPFTSANAGKTEQGNFSDILKTLGLDKYFPSKISILDAMAIKTCTGRPKLVDLPWMIIHKLLMIDFNARYQPSEMVNKPSREEESEDGDEFDFHDPLLEMQSSGDYEDNGTHLNTLDVMVAIFICCDNFLKQTLANKLFVCKLAIPFIYPLGTEDKIGMSLWALRTITVQCHAKHNEALETTVTGNSFPLVTFVRLGRPPLSKSKLINDILKDDSHDTFLHKDCISGSIRRITDGLVECSWFIKVGRKNDHLPGTTMVLNLRGDASSMKKQMEILQEISSVIFVTASSTDLTKRENTNTLQQISQTGAKVIILISVKNNLQTDYQVIRDLLKGLSVISSRTRQGIHKNASELKTEARRKLSKAISGCSGAVLEECAQRARTMGIIIDEYDDEACLESKLLAENIVSHMEGKQIIDCKHLLLPLQGAEWTEYCKLVKMHHRASGTDSLSASAYHTDVVKQKLYHLREKQVDMWKNSRTPFIKDFMSTLQKNPYIVMYFLKWIDLLLNEISRACIPGPRRQDYKAWTLFKKQEMTNLSYLKAHVDDADSRLARESFGLENLFRELGQIYEAVMGCGKVGQDTRADVEILPEIAAKLLLKGSPLEVVDGDTSSVPITWVTAVLSRLGNIIGGKRLFVLSVLGIQSSGKSTLLNTMFGLQFAVSAGGCTKGAYMQLIPVDKHANLPFDYVVVVDTEGLRAPELKQRMYEHDNELSTLVIGLGDVTMINIKGEYTMEMKDILQMTVHAFLRMNRVGKRIQDHRTCIFVHQNVPSASAEEHMKYGNQKLEVSLDEMTKEAALSENIANIHSFSQIISFGVQNHVWYFPDLWHGNPPMAPANPGYSDKVGEVRLNLLEEIAKRQTTFLIPSDLSIRLADLWNGVLDDDFVFSFRNSLEVKAYNSLQSKYYTLEWELQDSMKSWLHSAGLKLEICESIDDLESSFLYLTVELSRVLTENAEKNKKNLKEYFKSCNLRNIIIQWQQSKLDQLKFAVEQQKNEGEADLRSIKEARRVEIMQTQKWSKHEAYIMKKAVELAEEMKGKEVTDPEQEKKFDTMWLSMVHELAPQTEDKELQMDLVMEGILFQRFHAHGALLRDELERHSLNLPLKQTSLESSITLDDIRQEHVTLKTSLLKNIENLADENNRELEAAKQMTLVLTKSILNEIDNYLKGISNQDMKFQKTHAAWVVNILMKKIETFNQNAHFSKDYNFTIIPGYAVKLAVHVGRHCVQVFSLMQSKYNNKHGVKAKLLVYKNTAWSLFKNKVKQSTEEAMAGDLLCTHLKGVIQKAVKKAIPRKCIDEVLRDFQMTKYYLLVNVLEDLAEKENFKEYKAYLNDGKCFALKWITTYTNEKMFLRQGVNGTSRFAEIANSRIARIIGCITKSVENASAAVVEGPRDRRMELWIEKFCQSASEEIVVPVSTLTFVSDRSVVDFDNLQRIILDQLKRIQGSLEEAFAREKECPTTWDGKPPPQQILDQIWGCPEKCPFCHSPCVDNTPKHYSLYGRRHTCVQHRPRGLLGVRIFAGMKTGKNQLLNQTCNNSIQGKDLVFGCDACDFKCRDSGKCSATGMNIVYHKYTEYKTYFPEWDIAPDSSMSKYWMWVMANYKLHRDSFADVPPSWRSITKEEALADLKTIHH